MDKDYIKNQLSVEQVWNYVNDLGGEPLPADSKGFYSLTICHCGETHKLQYFANTRLFHCWTDCGENFDIFDLTKKVKSRHNPDYTFAEAVDAVAAYFGLSETPQESFDLRVKDWEVFNYYLKLKDPIKERKQMSTPVYDERILKYLPKPEIEDWLLEGIGQEAIDAANIRYDPIEHSIIIPHYDIENRLIGIRARTLIKEKEDRGKYMPAILNNKMYNHPLSLSLYHLNISKNNIKQTKKAVVFESEKSTLLYYTYFGKENDISVACCGSNLMEQQFLLLKGLGVEEIVICFDKQFKKLGDDEHKAWVKKLKAIDKKYRNEVLVSFVFDFNDDKLGYKDSPIDDGKDVFVEMFKERIFL